MAKKIQKGKAIEELVKGSLNFTMASIREAFRKQFPYLEHGVNYYIEEMFDGYVIVKSYNRKSPLGIDEFYMVNYEKSGEVYSFTSQDAWEVVELTYQLQTAEITEAKKKAGKRFEERIDPDQVQLLESKDDEKGTRRIRINDLMVAGKQNGNGRIYSESVIGAMVSDWKPFLRESRGQGRLMVLTGEVEHPSDKGNKRPEFLETVVRWDDLDWDGNTLNIEGDLILTAKGRDVEILMEAGVKPGGSIRGIGESKIKKIEGKDAEIVQWVSMNAADLVGDPSFVNQAMINESKKLSMEDNDMNLDELLKLLKDNPGVIQGITEAQIKEMSESQLEALENKMRAALGLDENADLSESMKEMRESAKAFEEAKKQTAISDALREATKDLPYGEKMNKQFTEAIFDAAPSTPEAVKVMAEAKRKEYGALAAAGQLVGLGWDEKKKSVKVIGSVLESETGTPDFARAAFKIHESMRVSAMKPMVNLQEGKTPNDIFAALVLKKFDELHRHKLLAESRMIEEAETTSDLNLPYSVARAITEEAFPNLVASGIYDVGVMNSSPERLYYETFAGETGYTVTVTDEEVDGGAEDVWYDLDFKRLTPGTVVVTSDPVGTTYVEGTDFIIDYGNGRILFLLAGAIEANDVLIDYIYTAVRLGEMQEIERGKVTLAYNTIEATADRLADQISREAIVFSASQLGWDAVTRTLASIAKQLNRKIDQGMLYKALTSALYVPSNSGGTWTYASDTLDDLVEKLGIAKVLVGNRYYEPTSYIGSMTNVERLSHWDGFTAAGARPGDERQGNGFAGRVNGLPVFWSTEFSDGYMLAQNREIVQHRIYQPMLFNGPYPTYGANGELIAADQYYAEEFNATESFVPEKAAYVIIA